MLMADMENKPNAFEVCIVCTRPSVAGSHGNYNCMESAYRNYVTPSRRWKIVMPEMNVFCVSDVNTRMA